MKLESEKENLRKETHYVIKSVSLEQMVNTYIP